MIKYQFYTCKFWISNITNNCDVKEILFYAQIIQSFKRDKYIKKIEECAIIKLFVTFSYTSVLIATNTKQNVT